MILRKYDRREVVISLATTLACVLKLISFTVVFDFLKIVSSWDRFFFSCFISGVIKGLCGRERQDIFL